MNANTDLLNQAIAAFHEETGIQPEVIREPTGNKDITLPDTHVKFPEQTFTLTVKVKPWVHSDNVDVIIEQIKRHPDKSILVANYINPNIAKRLKDAQVQYMDATGNALIHHPPYYIYIKGNKLAKVPGLHKDANRAFDKTGLKVVYGFLCDPTLVNKTYREIAKATGVALGTVGWVINGLKDTGFVVERENNRTLIQVRKLLDRWVEGYHEKLKPKLHVGDFIANNPDWWKNIAMEEFGGYWGGEIAAAKYTRYLQPHIATLYLPKEVGNQLLAKARLHKTTDNKQDAPGLVQIFRPFWPIQQTNEADPQTLTHPVLVYADLINTGDTRNIETARMIYDQYLHQYIGENTL